VSNICEVCDNSTNSTNQSKTCSKECGMIYRYLHPKGYTKSQIQNILNKTEFISNLSIGKRYYAYINHITELPKCNNCGKPHFRFKVNLKDTCSIECSKELTKSKTLKNCILCGKLHSRNSDTCSMSCLKTVSYINKLNVPLEDVKNFKINYTEFQDLSFSEKALCISLNIKKPRICPICGTHYIKFRKGKLLSTCSVECSNKWKYIKHFNKDEVEDYYKKYFTLPLTYSEKCLKFKHNIKEKVCYCGKHFISDSESSEFCSPECSSKRNIANLNNYNLEYVNDNFIDNVSNSNANNLFKVDEFMTYFNVSYSTMLRFKVSNNITIPNKNTTENKIFEFINDDSKISNDRTLIYPKEIDILVPKKLGIEYDGLMWHSFGKDKSLFNNYKNENKEKYKHLNKTKLCEDKNIQLFHIFENEWINEAKQNIWKSMINYKLKVNTFRVFARKCSISEISNEESFNFLEENHLQGSCLGSVKLGLFYNEELLSVMTFGKARFNKNVEYELIRFCSKLGYNIIGGASKLLKYFERNYHPTSIISYANRRWSTSINSQSSVYEKLGFEFKYNTQPNYFYFKSVNKLWSRNKFQKHKLFKLLDNFDKKLTETQNMYNNGYRKIYDCGNKVYIKEY